MQPKFIGYMRLIYRTAQNCLSGEVDAVAMTLCSVPWKGRFSPKPLCLNALLECRHHSQALLKSLQEGETQRYLVAGKPQSSCQPKENKEEFLLLSQGNAQLCAKGYLRCNTDVTHLQGMTTPQWTGCTTRVTQAPPKCKNSTKVT